MDENGYNELVTGINKKMRIQETLRNEFCIKKPILYSRACNIACIFPLFKPSFAYFF